MSIFSNQVRTVSEQFVYKIFYKYNLPIQDNKNGMCMFIQNRGKDKGKRCSANANENGYCQKHQGKESVIISNITKKKTNEPKQLTKTELDIINWFNTAIPNKQVYLKKCSKGLINEDTEFIFTNDYIVIGKKNGKDIAKLNNADIEVCENNGWKFDINCIETDDSEED
jgi:hypothetical protein